MGRTEKGIYTMFVQERVRIHSPVFLVEVQHLR